jgi:hypothetical protein
VRLIFVLPAVTVPLALGASIVVCRQLTDAARSLDAELGSLRAVLDEVRATRSAILALDPRRAGPPATPR